MIYRLDKGKFYPRGLHFGITTANRLKFEAKFDSSCVYDHGTVDNYDVNKLFGFSTDWYHHWNSARIGWRCIDNKSIEIMAYVYDRKKRLEPQVIGTILPEETVRCSITKRPSDFHFTMEQNGGVKSVVIPTHTYNWKFKYLLFPYFGGNMAAPHDMTLELNRVRE